MSISSSKHEVRSVHAAFDRARLTLGLNSTAYALNHGEGWRAQGLIISRLQEMGQTRLINLSHKYTDSAIAMPFYAGDGIVTKVMRQSDYDKTNPIYNLPAITSEKVNTPVDTFVINTYPWIPGGYVTPDEIEEIRTKMQAVGLDFAENDDDPRNFHKMPDANHTLIGIDASMYTTARNGKRQPEELGEAWRQYIEAIFPIYKTGEVPRQTAETSFQFRSIHDRETDVIGFDSTRFLEEGRDPIMRAAKQLSSQSRPIWERLFGWMGKDSNTKQEHEGPEPDSYEPS